ncbi:alkaline phosphatase family protein [Aeropyrum camini]|uniref:2,3-bisphosphoglycerate-independent phosphoglycerate mutase n=1 Tax=Aeropyrum camini SY1 = JCM 12091 TaxID=1198449 RepID=U3TEU2_9CREN|nr:2,3-bisphosphoglycerate-independent phosphoglycerate mutase [Aeropyrum camini]BAN90483.1 2,3-bisphosphoglycerate-independent [Aeropyrum camini SY1 = JCM 12091]
MKILYVVLDGAADSPSSPRRTLEEANKPNIDSLGSHAVCGMVYTVKPGVAPQSDYATLSLLGYNPEEYYPGRGPLEAFGAGIEMRRGDVALRANFATVDPGTLRIIDRRVGRSLTSREARELASAVDGMELEEGEGVALFRATIGHRGVLVLRHRRKPLSDAISNTDPAYERRGRFSVALEKYEPYIKLSNPLSTDESAVLAARMLNEFTLRAIEVLDNHPVNKARESRGLLKANAILSRDAGVLPQEKPPGFQEKFGLRGVSIVEMVVERGIARYIGLEDIHVEIEGRAREEVYREEAARAVEALETYDLVYVHLKGPDEPGHDGSFEGKLKAVEEIDKHFFAPLLDGISSKGLEPAFVITSDHATPWDKGAHSADPVPLMISHPGLRGSVDRFSESTCLSGGLGTIIGGYRIIPKALSLLKDYVG